MNNNEWYEKGELPPVGEKCLGFVLLGSSTEHKWVEVEVLKNLEKECAVYIGCYGVLKFCDEFKPIKSKQNQDREAFVKKLKHDVYLYAINKSDQISMKQSTGEHLSELVLDYLFNKGYGRKVKPINVEDFKSIRCNAGNIEDFFNELLENNHIVSKGE